MVKQTCHWKRCKVQIEVEPSTNQYFHVVGWCEFHQKVYGKQVELFSKLDKSKHHSEIANTMYQKDRARYNKIQKKAIMMVKVD